MTGGSLGLRTGSYGSLQQQLQNPAVLPIQTLPTRKLPKMLISSSREKERFLPRLCKIAGRRKVGMLLVVVFSVVLFTSLMSAITKDEEEINVPESQRVSANGVRALENGLNMGRVPSYGPPPPPPPPVLPFTDSIISSTKDTKSFISSAQNDERENNKSSLLLGPQSLSNESKTFPPVVAFPSPVHALPPGHPCKHFALPPPPADRKRIGPRPCPVCYLPVDEAIAAMPTDPSVSPVLKNLTYVMEEIPVLQPSCANLTNKTADSPSGGSPFGGYPTLKQRTESFDIKESMKVHCGFVKGNRPGHQTGFDIDEVDLLEMEQCHGIVVASAIFGNYDIIQQPKNISEASKRNICFFMFVDEETEAYMKNSSTIDNMMRVGLWRIVVVRNLPYDDARRNGKVPKLLLHRLFPNVRYSLWIDGKLELVVDPYQILERFLWRNGATFAISRHYRRFDIFDEAEANKAAGKYVNSSIDAQIEFYKKEGLTAYTPAKLPITSDVPEGCVIVREHIPITNLFTCLWFNEVDRFTSRDQLSFSTVRDKIMSKVPWSGYMFLDCERRNFVVQAYHRDLLEHMANIHPPPPVLFNQVHKKPSEENVSEKVVTSPTKKVPLKRGREKKSSSRRHRKIVTGKDTNSI
ncbi:probable hexosyltransferase MUCI70 [Aristolochia californica]|uniref:probable hexosyltransferase MUCI70 n=1 Tax=Aristolochia californica TaxID=171875 RepID=UPI0035E03365